MSVGNVSVFQALMQRRATTCAQVEENFCDELRASVALNEQAIAKAAADQGVSSPTLTPQQIDGLDLESIQRYGERMQVPQFSKAPRVEALANAYSGVVGSLRASAIMAATDVALLTIGGPLGVAILAIAVPIQAVVGAVQIHSALKGLQGVPMKDLNGQLEGEIASLKSDRTQVAQDPARQPERDQQLAVRIALLDEAHKTDPTATPADLFTA